MIEIQTNIKPGFFAWANQKSPKGFILDLFVVISRDWHDYVVETYVFTVIIGIESRLMTSSGLGESRLVILRHVFGLRFHSKIVATFKNPELPRIFIHSFHQQSIVSKVVPKSPWSFERQKKG